MSQDAAFEMMGKGDLVGAGRAFAQLFAASGDPGQGAMLLFAQCYTLDWGGAKATIDRLRQIAPQMKGILDKVQGCASAEWIRHARGQSLEHAGKRAALAPPPPFAILYAKAEHAHASNDAAGVKATLDEIARTRPKTPGVVTTVRGDAIPFVDFVDSDDLIGATFPVYHEGTVFDLPFAQLKSLEFLPKSDPFYALWPSVKFETTFGASGVVPFPSTYVGSTIAEDVSVRMGQTTMFDHDRGYCISKGLRDFWVLGADGSKRMMGLTHFARITFG